MTAAVVFDLDGVLVDSEPLWEKVRRRVVRDHGGRWQPDTQARLMGMSTGEWASYLSGELGVDLPADRVADLVIDQMEACYRRHLPLLPGAVEAVARLGARWPLGLASSSPRRLVDGVLAAAGLAQRFGAAVSTEEVAHGKPAPDVYLVVTEQLGVPAGSCVAVEDSSNGVRAAKAAGLRCVAIPRRSYPLDPDALALADAVLDQLGDLTEAFVASIARSGGR